MTLRSFRNSLSDNDECCAIADEQRGQSKAEVCAWPLWLYPVALTIQLFANDHIEFADVGQCAAARIQ